MQWPSLLEVGGTGPVSAQEVSAGGGGGVCPGDGNKCGNEI